MSSQGALIFAGTVTMILIACVGTTRPPALTPTSSALIVTSAQSLPTVTPTPEEVELPTFTPAPTFFPSPTQTSILTSTSTLVPTRTTISRPTATSASTQIPTAVATLSATATEVPIPTPTQGNSPTATNTPTPAPSPTATHSPIPAPTLEPTPTRHPTGNLIPGKPRDWESIIVVSNQRVNSFYRKHLNTELSVDGDTYVSFAVTNEGPYTINWQFYIDFYFDDLLVARILNDSGMSSGHFFNIDSWAGLPNIANIEPGEHTLKMVVDSTDLVPETSEDDNVYEQTFTWAQSEFVAQVEPISQTNLPDLAEFTPSGWGGPISVSSVAGTTSNSQLAVNLPTYISYGFQNISEIDIPEDIAIRVYLYLDETLVDIRRWRGMRAGFRGVWSEWDGIYDVINVTQGPHTLRVVIDPANLVAESNEENNIFESDFSWDSTPFGQ